LFRFPIYILSFSFSFFLSHVFSLWFFFSFFLSIFYSVAIHSKRAGFSTTMEPWPPLHAATIMNCINHRCWFTVEINMGMSLKQRKEGDRKATAENFYFNLLFLCIFFFLFWSLSTVFNFFFSMLNTNWLMIGNIGNRILVGQFYKWIEYAIICIFLKIWSLSFTHLSVSLSSTNPSA
jgi:hypothetical protein